ncbi:hypothetical protein [Actinomadura rubrisoli]|uniref:Uncharacterized protein n=1 Tax=Actinomadura rubrisoli TaxID=2530368 RepID=A0A4V2YV56_9ACTN|nr:hypothetical protein [Actinomadura rubrisoli]TDD79967.1 hypothetical protein E1298_26715 [Actinomadura rubrisoli]
MAPSKDKAAPDAVISPTGRGLTRRKGRPAMGKDNEAGEVDMGERFDGTEHLHAYPLLYALGNALDRRGFTTSVGARAVTVTRPGDASLRTQTITCKPRPIDGDRLWFFDALGEPIAQADQIIDAAVIIAADLASRDVATGDEQ